MTKTSTDTVTVMTVITTSQGVTTWTKPKVWVLVTDGHNLDAPAVNVTATRELALELISDMWAIWWKDNLLELSEAPPEPSLCHQGECYSFEHEDVHWENAEWHYLYEVEVSN